MLKGFFKDLDGTLYESKAEACKASLEGEGLNVYEVTLITDGGDKVSCYAVGSVWRLSYRKLSVGDVVKALA